MTLLEALLDGSSVDVKRSVSKPWELNIDCPFCEGGDSNKHLGINTRKGLAYCFRCHWSSHGFLHTARELRKALGIAGDSAYIMRQAREMDSRAPVREAKKDREEVSGLPEEYESLTGRLDTVGRRALEYLNSRCVSLLQIVHHKIGFAATGRQAWRILFPVMDTRGTVHGCVGRTFTDQSPRYLNTPGLKHLWGVHRHGSTAVLCEGVMDALNVERALMTRGNWVSLARLGSGLTAIQYEQLREYERVIVYPDADRPGIEAAAVLGENCAAMGIRVSMVIPAVLDDGDPGSRTMMEISGALEGAVAWKRDTARRLRESMNRFGDL